MQLQGLQLDRGKTSQSLRKQEHPSPTHMTMSCIPSLSVGSLQSQAQAHSALFAEQAADWSDNF